MRPFVSYRLYAGLLLYVHARARATLRPCHADAAPVPLPMLRLCPCARTYACMHACGHLALLLARGERGLPAGIEPRLHGGASHRHHAATTPPPRCHHTAHAATAPHTEVITLVPPRASGRSREGVRGEE